MVYRLYAAPFVSWFVHSLRLAGMTFNNICRFKKKIENCSISTSNSQKYPHRILFSVSLLSEVTPRSLAIRCTTQSLCTIYLHQVICPTLLHHTHLPIPFIPIKVSIIISLKNKCCIRSSNKDC
jgi:hypothetical protein